ncbi:MAG: hypothetical protein K6C98_09385 [Treponema sp.]|nr:hypothetical protein [Treponema sp.]
MKKLLVFLGLIVVGSFAFANIELDTTLYGSPFNQRPMKGENDAFDFKLKEGFAFGSEDSVAFYFGDKSTKFDIGLGIFVAFDIFSTAKFDSDSVDVTGINFAMGIGPAFRYSFSEKFSLFARPSFAMGITGLKPSKDNTNDVVFSDFSALFDLNVGGRSWLLNADGFHLGITYGAIFEAGAGSGIKAEKQQDDIKYDVSNVAFKIYVGACFNFGDRGIDR